MNERIRQLILKAEHGSYGRMAFGGKLAELIVRECKNIVAKRKDQAIDDGWNVDEAMSMAEMDLLERFKVEEPKGWVCSKCGVDRTKAVCPKGHTAALTGECPMIGVEA